MSVMRPEPLKATQLAKLPAYVQMHISHLARLVEELDAKLTELTHPEDVVSTHADPYSDHPRPVGDYPTLLHRFADGAEMYLDLEPHRVHVSVTGASVGRRFPVAVPVVSNALDIVALSDAALPVDRRRKAVRR